MSFKIIYLISVFFILLIGNTIITQKRTWRSFNVYIVNLCLIVIAVIVYLFIKASGGFYWWRIDPEYWAYFGSSIAALLLAATIIFQVISFRRQQVENKFFELVKYYRDNVQEMQLRNPFYYKDRKGRESEDQYVTGRRVMKIIFDQYSVACRIVYDIIGENCHSIVLKEGAEGKYEKYYKRIKECTDLDKDRFLINEIAYLITFWGVPKDATDELNDFFKEYYSLGDLTEKIRKIPVLYEYANPEKLSSYFRTKFEFGNKPMTKVVYGQESNSKSIKFFGGHQYQLGHFFRHIFQAVRYIDEQPKWLLSKEMKQDYIKTLRAQMSNYEQALLFINSLSKIGRRWEYDNDENKKLISDYNMVKNLPKYFVPDMIPDKYYPDVDFEYIDNTYFAIKVVRNRTIRCLHKLWQCFRVCCSGRLGGVNMNGKYFKITDTDLSEKIKSVHNEEVGTYRLLWVRNGKPKKICRLLDIDCDGILYIGETEDTLYNRVTSLAISILSNSDESQAEPVEKGHKTLSKKFFRIRKHINVEDLYVEVHSCKISPKEDESKMLEEYVASYGELPPLNGSYGKYANWKLF